MQNTISFYRFASFMDLQTGYLAQIMLEQAAQKITDIQLRETGIKATLPPEMWQISNLRIVALCVIAPAYAQFHLRNLPFKINTSVSNG